MLGERPAASVPDSEALPAMLRRFKLIDKRNGIVLHRNAALLLLVRDELVLSQAKLARALARDEVGGRSQVCPVDRSLPYHVQRTNVCLGDRVVRHRRA